MGEGEGCLSEASGMGKDADGSESRPYLEPEAEGADGSESRPYLSGGQKRRREEEQAFQGKGRGAERDGGVPAPWGRIGADGARLIF